MTPYVNWLVCRCQFMIISLTDKKLNFLAPIGALVYSSTIRSTDDCASMNEFVQMILYPKVLNM